MNENDARAIAKQLCKEDPDPEKTAIGDPVKCYIELGDADPEQPAPVRDVLVWLVRIEKGDPVRSFVELAIDDKTGRVVREEKAR